MTEEDLDDFVWEVTRREKEKALLLHRHLRETAHHLSYLESRSRLQNLQEELTRIQESQRLLVNRTGKVHIKKNHHLGSYALFLCGYNAFLPEEVTAEEDIPEEAPLCRTCERLQHSHKKKSQSSL